jgi:toxin ParE1/3/4
LNVVYEPEARRDLLDAVDWALGHFGAVVAIALQAEASRVVEAIAADPAIGVPMQGGRRALPLRRFPYTVHYRLDPTVIRIFAFSHQRRRPRSQTPVR